MVFSVHGMGPDTSQDHFTRVIMDRVNRSFGAEHFDARSALNGLAATRGPRSVMRVLRQRLPPRLQHAIGRAVPLRWKDAVVNRAVTSGYDWARTPGLAVLGGVTSFNRFNLRGREKAGMLEPGSEVHRSYTRWVQNALQSWRHADTGEGLLKEVAFTGEEFGGERSVYLPDVVVSWGDRLSSARITSSALGSIELKPPTGRTGNHRPDGFAIVVDPQRPRAGPIPQGEIVDLAPMVRRLLDRQT